MSSCYFILEPRYSDDGPIVFKTGLKTVDGNCVNRFLFRYSDVNLPSEPFNANIF